MLLRAGVDLDAYIAQRQAQCRRARTPLALLLLRLHNVADLEQRLGATATQGMCMELHRRLQRQVRDTDEVVLLDGGDCAVLLPGAVAVDAAVIQARLQAALTAPYRIGPLLLAPQLAMTCMHWPVDALEAALPTQDAPRAGKTLEPRGPLAARCA